MAGARHQRLLCGAAPDFTDAERLRKTEYSMARDLVRSAGLLTEQSRRIVTVRDETLSSFYVLLVCSLLACSGQIPNDECHI